MARVPIDKLHPGQQFVQPRTKMPCTFEYVTAGVDDDMCRVHYRDERGYLRSVPFKRSTSVTLVMVMSS